MKLCASIVLAYLTVAYAAQDQLQRQLEDTVGRHADHCGNDFVAANCDVQCLFGWKHDDNNCPTCACVTEGDEPLYQGDIKLSPDVKEILSGSERGTVSNLNLRWTDYPDGNGNYNIPYIVSTSNGDVHSVVNAAKDWFAANTCVRLVPRTNHQNYVQVILYNGCWSQVGRVGGVQQLSLGYGCHLSGTAIHEFLHAAGVFHEQSRPDRDNYIRILWNNISESMKYNFNKQAIDSLGSPYETKSIMHYYSGAFATSGNSMVTIDGGYIPWNYNPTAEDGRQMKKFYGC